MMGRDGAGNDVVEIKVHPRRENNVRSAPPYQNNSVFKKWVPWLVPLFVVSNIAVFIAVMYVNDCPANSGSCAAPSLGRFSFQPLKENPLLGPSSSTLVKMGALDVARVVNKNQSWRLISCIWLHAGVFHVVANMLSLLLIGIRLEQEFGFFRVGLVYIISGFGGSISVGASGALFGLLGGMLSELITNWTIYANKVAALTTLLCIIAINLAVGLLPHVDNYAHIGGFLSGFFLGFVFLIRPSLSGSHVLQDTLHPQLNLNTRRTSMCCGLFTLGMVALLRGVNVNDHCSWCHYLSCVPTSLWSCNSRQVSCQSAQLGNQLNLTCMSNGKSNLYYLSGDDLSKVQQLCAQLCN
uniref:RHOMBOID-like protein n=1 Tax=Salix viminalis TaxID=40686 RepID=A0A6N2MWF7_SALVM